MAKKKNTNKAEATKAKLTKKTTVSTPIVPPRPDEHIIPAPDEQQFPEPTQDDDGITPAPIEVTTPSNVLKLAIVPLMTIRAGQKFYITIADGKIFSKGCKVTIA